MPVISAEMVCFVSPRAKSGDGKHGEGIAQIVRFLKKSARVQNAVMHSCIEMSWYYEMILLVWSRLETFRHSKQSLY